MVGVLMWIKAITATAFHDYLQFPCAPSCRRAARRYGAVAVRVVWVSVRVLREIPVSPHWRGRTSMARAEIHIRKLLRRCRLTADRRSRSWEMVCAVY